MNLCGGSSCKPPKRAEQKMKRETQSTFTFQNKKELFNSTEPMQSFSISDDELPTKGLKDH